MFLKYVKLQTLDTQNVVLFKWNYDFNRIRSAIRKQDERLWGLTGKGADKLVLLHGAYLQRWLGANLKWGETFSYQCKLLQCRPQSSNGEASMQIVNFCFWYLKFSLWIKCFSCRRPGDENHPAVKPDGYVDNLAQAVELILKYNWAEYYTEWMNWCVMTKDSLVSLKENVDIGKERKEFNSVRIGFVHQYVHHLIGLVTNQGA